MSGYSRGVPAMGDVLRSVLVLGAVVIGLWFVGQLFTVTPENPTSDADWRGAASGVQERADFKPLTPAELPDGWRATRAELVGERWQLGLLTEEREYVGLTQQRGDADALQALVEDRAPGSEPASDVPIGGTTWQAFTSDEHTTYATAIGPTVVVVTTSATAEVLRDYIASLEPFSG